MGTAAGCEDLGDLGDGFGAGFDVAHGGAGVLVPGLAHDELQRDVGLYSGDVAFSPDGKLMALEMAPGVIHLKEVSTARTVARLHDPVADRSGWMAFGADGTKLIALSSTSAVHVWDFRVIRDHLRTMDLDWDWPEFPPLNGTRDVRPSAPPHKLKIQVIEADDGP